MLSTGSDDSATAENSPEENKSEIPDLSTLIPPGEVQARSVYSLALREAAASPRSAVVTSCEGVYVVRSTGAALTPSVLKAGTYLVVPSTFQPSSCQYTLDVFVTPSVAGSEAFKFVETS